MFDGGGFDVRKWLDLAQVLRDGNEPPGSLKASNFLWKMGGYI